MSRELTILVIGVSGNVSIGILKALRQSELKITKLYGACIKKNAAGFHFSDEAFLCPLASDPSFKNWLEALVDRRKIDVVLSGVEEVNAALSAITQKPNAAIYLAPEAENLAIFNDKLKTAHWLKSNGIGYPKTIDLDDREDVRQLSSALAFPLIVKPKRGKGSANISIINHADELIPYLQKGGFIAQELIGSSDQEYTCGVYKSSFGYTEVIVMRRELVNGSTAVAEVVQHDAIANYCRAIANALNTTCPFNVQLRLSADNHPICFEINMRLSGTTAMRHHFGFKDCEAWITEAVLNQNARELFNVVPKVAIRYEEEVYFEREYLDQLRLTLPATH